MVQVSWRRRLIKQKIAQGFEPFAHAKKRGGGVPRKRGERGGENWGKRGEPLGKRGDPVKKRGGWWCKKTMGSREGCPLNAL